MQKFYFLNSYSKLVEFVGGLRSTLVALPDEKERESILVEVAAFSINKHRSDDRRRLQANDYFTTIIGASIKSSIDDPSEISRLYAEVVKCLLPLTKVDECSLGPVVNGCETRLFFNRGSANGSFFLVASHELSSYLSGYCENLRQHQDKSSHGTHELAILFEDPNTGLSTKVVTCNSAEDYQVALIASLFTIICHLLQYSNRFQDSDLCFGVAEGLEKNGYAVVLNFADLHTVNELKKITYSIAHNQAEMGAAYVYGNDARLQRIYNLIGKHDIYWNFLLDERVQSIAETFFKRNTLHDKFFLSSYQANILYPGATAQILHTDLSMPEPLPPWPVRLNVNLAIDEFTVSNGATLVVPGSHHSLKKPNALYEDVPLIPVTVPSGSLVIWTGHLWHKSGANISDKPRAALLACFAASYIRELAVEENYLAINSSDLLARMPRPLKALIGGFHGIKKGA